MRAASYAKEPWVRCYGRTGPLLLVHYGVIKVRVGLREDPVMKKTLVPFPVRAYGLVKTCWSLDRGTSGVDWVLLLVHASARRAELIDAAKAVR